MTKVILTFGLLAGAIVGILVWVFAWLSQHDMIDFDRLAYLGYANMLIALSMVFFGIKSYRDNYLGGKITFWKGVQVGLLISLIAGVLYFTAAQSYNMVNPGFQAQFMQKLTDEKVGKLQQQGASQEQIESAKAEIALAEKLFQNPFLFFVVCVMEIFVVGVVVTVISSALLRRRELLPAAA